jgi:hypothetical protein
MDAQEKIQRLNTLAETLRVTLAAIGNLWDDNPTVEHLIWRINKHISLMHQEICKSLEKQITYEDFNKIIKNLEHDLGDSK